MEEDGRSWKKLEEVGRSWKKKLKKQVETIEKTKFLKVVGDALGTLVGVRMAQKTNEFRPGYD